MRYISRLVSRSETNPNLLYNLGIQTFSLPTYRVEKYELKNQVTGIFFIIFFFT